MSKNRTKAEIQLELTQAQKRIAELETAVARESEDRFASVFRVSPAQMALTDAASGKYVEVNAAFLQTLGFAREEVIGRTALELNLFHNPAQRTELLQRMVTQGTLRNEHVLVHAKTGEVRHGIFSAEYVHVNGQKHLLTIMNDVTEKLQAEQRWQFALESAGYGVWDWDAQTNRVFFSRQWKSMLGYEEHEIGDALEEWSGRVHPDDLAAAMEKVNAHLEGRIPAYVSEHRIRCKDGTYKWILDSGRVIEWTQDHKPLRVIGTHKDISEGKTAEEKLRASEEHYRALVESLDVSLCRWLPDTTLTYANEKYKRIFGLQDDTVGQKWLDFLPEETRASTATFYGNVAKDPHTVTYEHPVNVEDGSVRHYHWTDTPILDERGNVLEFQSVGMDITERKNAENALRENEARLKGFLDAAPDAMVIVNTEGSILLVNAQAESMFGYSRSELAGMAVETLMPGSQHAQHVENRAKFMAQPHNLTAGSARDLLALRKNGEEFPIEISLSHHKMVTGESVVLRAVRDVTEHKRAEEAQRQSHDLLAATEKLAHIGGWEWDVGRRTMTWTEETYRIHGMQPGEPAAGSPEHIDMSLSCYDPSDRTVINDAFLRCTEEGKSYDMEFPITRVDGQRIWIRTKADAVKDGERVIRVVGNIQNITERKQTEQALRFSEAKWRSLFETCPAGIALANVQGEFLDANPAYLAQLGYTRDEMAKIRYQDYTPPKWQEREAQNVAQLKASGVPMYFEKEHIRKDGTVFPVALTGWVIREGGGSPDTLGAFVQDISERRHAEDALRASESRYRLLVETSIEGIWSMDREHRTDYVNQSMVDMLGYEAAEMLGRKVEEFFFPEDLEAHQTHMEKRHSGQDEVYERRFRRRDGSQLWTLVSARVQKDSQGNFNGSFAMFTDITERKLAEQALKESEERFSTAFFSSPVAQVILTQENREILVVNDACCRLSEYSREELVGAYPGQLNLWKGSADPLPILENLQRTGRLLPHETALRLKSGALYTVIVAMEPITWKGQPCLVTSIFDITERKLAEEKLADTERRYRALIENAPDGIVLISSDGRFKYASPSVTRIFGYDQEEIPQQSPVEMTHPEDLPLVLAELMALIEDPGRISTLQYRFRHKNGGWRWIESTFSNLLSTPNVEAIIINFRDIHERKLAEEELMKSQELLKEAQRIGRIGHMEWNGRGAHMTCSDELYNILGLPRDTVVNQEVISRLMMPGERDRLLQLDRQAIQQRHDMNYEYRIRLKDGSQRWLHQMGKVTYDENGAPIRMMAIVQDVTERKQVEETLRENRTRIEMALKGADAGMWDWNVKTGETVFNERWAEMAGYTLKELEPVSIQTWVNLCHPDDLKISEMLLQKHFTGETEYYECEARMQHKNGSWVWVIDRGKVMEWDADGNPVRMFGTHLDVTERKQTELALRASEEKYRGLMESLDNAISTTAYDGTILYLNDTAAENLGGTPQELIGKKLHELFPEPFASRQLAAVQDVFQTNHEAVYETPSMVKSGLRWFRVAFQPLHDETGQVTQVLVNVTDIHDLKATQQELQELNRTLEEKVAQRTAEVQDLYNNAPIGYHSLDTNGKFVMVNQTELNWLGYTREELVGHAARDFLTEESKNTFRENFPLFLQRGWLKDLELEFVRKDGSILPVSLNATAIRDGAGNLVMSRSTLFDITERKRAESALRESEEQNRLLFEVSPVPIALLGEAGQIVRANHAYEQLTGIPWSDLNGKTSAELGLVDAQVINDLTQAMLDAISKRENFTVMEHSLTSSDGTKRFVESRVFLLPVNSINHILVTSNDISTYKKAEEALQLANRELERSLRLKDEFLANMSHELRTPLNAILGISESLGEQVIGPLNDKQQKYIQTVLESSQHLLSLINDILDLAKINAGKIELEMAGANLAAVAQSSLRMVRELAQKKGQSLNFEMDPSITHAWVDERRLKQMLVNLLSNAVKFTPQGGSIGLEVRGDRQHNILQFSVWDTGIGIHPDDLPRLFRPFAQLDASLTRGAQGTGLGLVLVSQMARLHGGSISVESEPGRGTRFTISIPWVQAGVTAPLRAGALPPDSFVPAPSEEIRPKIVLVEDTEVVTMLIGDYLTHHGYQVYTAGNGIEGLAMVQQVRPDVILMDIMMPKMDGLETTRQIRARPGFEHTPIIALTALAMSGDRERCLEAGMNDYLSKPVNLPEMLTLIARHLAPIKDSE